MSARGEPDDWPAEPARSEGTGSKFGESRRRAGAGLPGGVGPRGAGPGGRAGGAQAVRLRTIAAAVAAVRGSAMAGPAWISKVSGGAGRLVAHGLAACWAGAGAQAWTGRRRRSAGWEQLRNLTWPPVCLAACSV